MDGLPRGLDGLLDVGALVRRHEVQTAEKARAKLVRKHEQALARRARLLARARRAVPRHAVLGSAAGVLVIASGGWTDWVFGPLAAVSAVVVVRAVTTLRHPPPVPVPPSVLTAPPPVPPDSVAWPAVRRLDGTREQIARLSSLVGPGGRAAAAEALAAADDADTALRWQAVRLAAVEPHRGPDDHLLAALLDGVDGQERLVAAFADLVAASDPRSPATAASLQDAADRLHGLADGLRELG